MDEEKIILDNSTETKDTDNLIMEQKNTTIVAAKKRDHRIILVLFIGAIAIVVVTIIILLIINHNNGQNASQGQTQEDEKNTIAQCNDADLDYSIKFDVADGNEVVAMKVCKKCDNSALLPTPTNEDKIFDGWYYDPEYHNRVSGDKVFNVTKTEVKNSDMCIVGYDDVVLYAKWRSSKTDDVPNSVPIKVIGSDEELSSKLNQLMVDRGYNEYAIKVIKTLIPDYQKLFTNNEIYDLFYKVKKITLNPYDPERPNLSHDFRAHNASGDIVVNCFAGELDGDGNFDGLRWLLTHEIMHSLGDFPSEYMNGSFGVYTPRNALLEEGLVDSIAHFVKGTTYETGYDIHAPHAYSMSGDIIMLFNKIGCYDAVIHANIDHSFNGLKACMVKRVNNGEQYFEKLFEQINGLYLYTEYPNSFPSKEDLIAKYSRTNNLELINFIKNNTLSKLWDQYEALSEEIIDNKV